MTPIVDAGETATAPIACLVPDLPDADAILPYLRRIDGSRIYTNGGPLTRELEARAAAEFRVAAAACIATSSGTSALQLALHMAGVRAGATVVVPAFTFPATALAAIALGARIVLADVAPGDWLLTPALVEPLLATCRVDAVVPVGAMGAPVPVAAWEAFQARTAVPVVIDAAAGFGQQDASDQFPVVFSLHATKPFGAGEGGLVAAPSGDWAETARRLANFGFDGRVCVDNGGFNGKMSEYTAAVALAQLRRLPALRRRRLNLYQRYRARAHDFGVGLQEGYRAGEHPALFGVELPADASVVADHMARRGVETRRWYCPALEAHPGIARHLDPTVRGRRPVVERLAQRTLGLPFHGFLTAGDEDAVWTALGAALSDPST